MGVQCLCCTVPIEVLASVYLYPLSWLLPVQQGSVHTDVVRSVDEYPCTQARVWNVERAILRSQASTPAFVACSPAFVACCIFLLQVTKLGVEARERG